MTITISGSVANHTITSDPDNAATITSGAQVTGNSVYGALYGVGTNSNTWTVVNAGSITGTGVNGIQLGAPSGGDFVADGVVTNQTGGSIAGTYGVRIYNFAGASSVVNQAGAAISANGSLVNAGAGVGLYNAGTVTNYGVITGSTAANGPTGVLLPTGGVVYNRAAGTIQSYVGVYVGGTGTVTNAGTIVGGSGGTADAVAFAAGANNSRLIVDPGAVFTGNIYGGTGGLELASAASAGRLSGLGVSITGFTTLQFDTGAAWTVAGTDAAAGLGTIAITGFDAGDTIDLTGFAAVSETYSGNKLTLTNAGAATTTIAMQGGTYGTGDFQLSSDLSGGTFIVDCFAVGTRIATQSGLVRVENLTQGDIVKTHFSGTSRIKWIGRRQVDCSRHPEPRKVWPVRVTAGAFGFNQPCRDLLLSPNHGVFVNGELIPVSCLIDGVSIVQTPVDQVTYFHIELPEHDLLLAEGVLAESYLDVGDRSNFSNGGGDVGISPDFGNRSPDVAAVWETLGCVPLIIHGPRLEAARTWLAELSAAPGLARAA